MQMLPNDFRDALREGLLSVLWRQWSALGVATHSPCEDLYPVDLEALLVATAVLSFHDQRLTTLADEWLGLNRGLVLRTRIVRMCRALERQAGGHHVKLAPLYPEHVIGAGKTGSTASKRAVPAPTGVAVAQINLRRVFGINARADILLHLLSGRSGSSAGIARAVWFDQKAVYRILESWAEAGVCTRPGLDSAAGYSLVQTAMWSQLPGLAGPVRWVDWPHDLFPLVLLHHACATPPRAGDVYLLSSLMRELHGSLSATGRAWGVHFPDGRSHLGQELFPPAATAVLKLVGVMAGEGR